MGARMLETLNRLFRTIDGIERPDSTAPEVKITIIVPEDKMSTGWSVILRTIVNSNRDQKSLVTTVGGDHFLIESTSHEKYIEYLPKQTFERMKELWAKGAIPN